MLTDELVKGYLGRLKRPLVMDDLAQKFRTIREYYDSEEWQNRQEAKQEGIPDDINNTELKEME